MEKIKNIQLTGADGLPVLTDIFFVPATKKKPVIIYCHGFNGFKDWGNFDLIAASFAEAGYVFIKFNFSHNGTSVLNPETFDKLEAFGKNNYTKELTDLNMITDWVTAENNPYAQQIDASLVYLIGHSMGGGISILFAAEDNRVKKLITWAAVHECKTPWGNWPVEKMAAWKDTGVAYYQNGRTNQQMPLYYQLYEDYQQNEERLNIKKAISHLNIPLLLCHGSLDPAVPVAYAYLLKQWQPKAILFILETDHVFGRKHPWIENYLPEATALLVNKTIGFLNEDH